MFMSSTAKNCKNEKEMIPKCRERDATSSKKTPRTKLLSTLNASFILRLNLQHPTTKSSRPLKTASHSNIKLNKVGFGFVGNPKGSEKKEHFLILRQGKENHSVVQLEFHTWADNCGSYKYLYHEPGFVYVRRAELPSAGLGF